MENVVYHFDTLPLRPRPQPLESFTSYLTRIAQTNGIRNLSHLKLFIDHYVNISTFADYSPHSFGKLATLTRRNESELLRTTFFHAGKKFGRVFHSQSQANFLVGLIAPSLRYCPLCLQENPYYSLVWRFLLLRGCPKHACVLLEVCGHCEYPIPVFSSPLRMGICPACHKDMRLCIPSRLKKDELQEVSRRYREIEYLLYSFPWESIEPVFVEKLGMEFTLLRNEKHLRSLDVINQTTLSWRTIEAIECGRDNTNRASLRWYLEYAHFLGVSLDSLFTTMLKREEGDPQIRSLRVKRYFLEDDVLEQVQEVIERLHAPESPLTLKALSTATGISSRSLKKHPRVKELLEGILHEDCEAKKRGQVSEEELLAEVRQAVKALAGSGEPITYTSVSHYIRMHPTAFVHYPLVKRFIQQHVNYTSQQFKRAEQTLLEKVRTAVLDLKFHQQPVTWLAVSRSIGIHSSTLKFYPQVREYVEQNLDSRYLSLSKRQKEREEALFPCVEEAIHQLESLNKSVTFEALGKLLGIRSVTLKTYPRVSELVEQKGDTSLQRRKDGRSEEEVYVKVQLTIQELRNHGKNISFTSVAREMGMDCNTLKTYPRIRTLLAEDLYSQHLYQQQQLSLHEDALLRQVEEAISELEALHIPVTQQAIFLKIGHSRSYLKRYSRIKAVIEQKANGYHDYQTRCDQPEEGELLHVVKEAVAILTSQGMPVTRVSIARQIRIRSEVLMQYPLVVTFLVQQGCKKLKPGSERAEELYGLVQEAIHACKSSGLPITKGELSRIVGVKYSTLYNYPTVRELMTQTVKEDELLTVNNNGPSRK